MSEERFCKNCTKFQKSCFPVTGEQLAHCYEYNDEDTVLISITEAARLYALSRIASENSVLYRQYYEEELLCLQRNRYE